MTARLSREDTAKGKLQRIALEYLHEKHARGEIPTSIRFLFYELEQRGQQTKQRREPKLKPDGTMTRPRLPSQNLTDAVTVLREAGQIPWDWLVDDSRTVYHHQGDPSIGEGLLGWLEVTRLDPWLTGRLPVLLTEARTTAGVLERRTARDYCVPVVPTGGQCAGFLHTKVARLLTDPRTVVVYVGDLDLAGADIEANSRRVLERATGRTFGPDDWERLAITAEQTADLVAKGPGRMAKGRIDPRRGAPNHHDT